MERRPGISRGWAGAAAILLAALVSACAPHSAPYQVAPIPEAPGYASVVPAGHTRYSNESLANLFTELTHGLEWGARRPGLIRFEGPVSVRMTGQGSEQYQSFLKTFLAQVRTHTGLDIRAGSTPSPILVRFVPGSEFRAWTTNQCVIIYGQPSWPALLEDPERYGARAFEEATTQIALTIIIPDTSPPHEIRECLMEEITQALGTSNDLYGLGSSIFNDDNAHTWPTRLDYLMLRVLYDPRMGTGLGEDETRRRARTILDELHLDGREAPSLPPLREAEFADWRRLLQAMPVLGSGMSTEALQITGILVAEAERIAPGSTYHCEAAMLDSIARHHLRKRSPLTALISAQSLCAEVHGPDDVRLAQLGIYIAVEHLDRRAYQRALDIVADARETLLANGQEGLVASSYVITWAAHFAMGDLGLADQARSQIVNWSAYAFGSDSETVQDWASY